MNITWDASAYTSHFSFVHEYGAGVLDLVQRKEHMKALDLGCGNGALTRAMADQGMDVCGLDASPELLDIARCSYPDLCFMQGDATNFSLPEKVDVVFSNAVFHWIDRGKQRDMMDCVYRALGAGGQFVFEFGGYGNTALIHESLARAFAARKRSYWVPFYFPTIGEYASLLEDAGFTVVFASLFDRMTPLKGENGMADWIRMFVQKPFEGLSVQEESALVEEAVAGLKQKLFHDGTWFADYVRIRCKAVKRAAS